MDIDAAVRAAAPNAPQEAIEGLRSLDPDDPLLASADRLGNGIGQCAHESLGFTRTVEVMSYSAERLMEVWPSRFRTERAAKQFARSPRALANKVYGRRMGNVNSDDGWRFRGRGYIQLTGRHNYARYGELIGVDIVADPELAALPEYAWRLASAYMSDRKWRRRTALEWADRGNLEAVTRAINGGLHGLEDRRLRTTAALVALRGVERILRLGHDGDDVMQLQHRLAFAGFSPGPLDGDFGLKTEAAVIRFQRNRGLNNNGIVDEETLKALGLEQRLAA